MSLNSLFRVAAGGRHRSTLTRRRRPALTPTLESLEGRLVLSQGTSMVAMPVSEIPPVMPVVGSGAADMDYPKTGVGVSGLAGGLSSSFFTSSKWSPVVGSSRR